MTIQSIPEWAACRQIASWPDQSDKAEKIFKGASPTQLDELIGIAETGELADQHVALSVLDHFARARYDLRWNLERRDCLIRTLRQLIIEKYPQAIGRHPLCVLRLMDYPWVDEFLSTFPLDQVSEKNSSALIFDLSNQVTEAARAQLKRMAQAGWEEAARIKWTDHALPLSSPPTADDWHYNPPTRLSGPLVGSPEWQRLIKSDNVSREIGLWLHFLNEKDIADLAGAWDRDDPNDHRCAGAVLGALAVKQEPRLAPERERILKRAESLGRQSFQELGRLPSEYYVIKDFDRERAIDFVLSSLDQAALTRQHEENLFREMKTLRSPRVIARIQQLAEQGGKLATDAAIYLDEAGPATPERIESKAERWRQKRNARDLSWLYFQHLEKAKPGTPIDSTLRLLGKPTEKGERFFSWKSRASRVRLYIETDKNGQLDWMRLYEE
jgi:hypothetical protein